MMILVLFYFKEHYFSRQVTTTKDTPHFPGVLLKQTNLLTGTMIGINRQLHI
jgi:hypothetical protein